MLMNPGGTASPLASITLFPFADLKSPTPAIRSLRIPTSARFGSAPLPSKTVPPLIITSKSAAPGDDDGSCANIGNTIVMKTARQKKFRFIALIQGVSSDDVDLKTFAGRLSRTAGFRRGRAARTCCRGQRRDAAIAGLAARARRFEQHTRRDLIVRDRTDVICRLKEIFVAVFDSNFGIEVERNHPAHLFENLQEFCRRHVFVTGVPRHPKLDNRFLPAVRLPPAI